jgi:hypothetical protein
VPVVSTQYLVLSTRLNCDRTEYWVLSTRYPGGYRYGYVSGLCLPLLTARHIRDIPLHRCRK